MTNLMPRDALEEFIRKTGYIAGQRPQQPAQATQRPNSQTHSGTYSVEQLLNGQPFYDDSLAKALQNVLHHAGPEGIVLTMPEHIAAKAHAEKTHKFWQESYTVHTEENIGMDRAGRFYTKNEPVFIVIHGGGILTPTRIQQAYDQGLFDGSAQYIEGEFESLLEGRLPGGITIPLHRFEEIKDMTHFPHQFGIVLPYKTAQDTKSGQHQKKQFLENPLVIARTVGSLDKLEQYYEKAQHDQKLGNYHPFRGCDATTPQGRVLFLNVNDNGLLGNSYLDFFGRFVGVAPEAPGARK